MVNNKKHPIRNFIIFVLFICLFLILLSILVELYNENNIEQPEISKADIIIIGGGTAGCLAARKLSINNPNKKVLLLERGTDKHTDKNIYNISKAPTAAYNANYSEIYKTDFSGPVTLGKMFGGGSSRNFGLVVTGTTDFYMNNWSNILNISEEDLTKRMKDIENCSGSNLNNRGKDGYIHMSILEEKLKIYNRIIPASLLIFKYGIIEWVRIIKRSIDVYNNTGPLGASEELSNIISNIIRSEKNVNMLKDYNSRDINITTGVTIKPQIFIDSATGLRSSSDNSYLSYEFIKKDINGNGKKDNLSINSLSTIDKLILDGNIVKSVVWKDKDNKDQTTILNEGGKIVMACGGLSTPFILQKSGIVNDDIGKNLINHYGCQLIFKVKDVKNKFSFSLGPVAFLPRDNIGNAREWQYLFSGDNSANTELLDIVKEDYVTNRKDKYKYISLLSWLLKPKTRGSVNNTDGKIDIKLNMFGDGDTSEDSDKQNVLEMIKLSKSIIDKLRIQYIDEKIEIVYPPVSCFSSDTELFDYILKGISETEHYCGTCKLGKVVKPYDFSIINYPNIHVIDTSVFPEIPDGNTAFPTYLMADIACDRI